MTPMQYLSDPETKLIREYTGFDIDTIHKITLQDMHRNYTLQSAGLLKTNLNIE